MSFLPEEVRATEVIGKLEDAGFKHIHTGKTTEVFAHPLELDLLVLYSTDRCVVDGIVLGEFLQGRGLFNTALNIYWLKRIFHDWKNHFVASGSAIRRIFPSFPSDDEMLGRCLVVRRVEMPRIRVVVHGNFVGNSFDAYKDGFWQRLGYNLPSNLKEGAKLSRNIFVPLIKSSEGVYKEASFEAMVISLGGLRTIAMQIKKLSLGIFKRANDITRTRNVLIANAKFEFGVWYNEEGDYWELFLTGQVLTPRTALFLRYNPKKEIPLEVCGEQALIDWGGQVKLKADPSHCPPRKFLEQKSDWYRILLERLSGEEAEKFFRFEMGIGK